VGGYPKLAAMKNELLQTHKYVGVVSGGDYVQGQSLGVISRGEYIVKLMNLVGYDALTLGNHEFDYKLDRLNELVGMMNTKPISCNFQKIGEDASYFEPYSIVSYGDVEIAYIGITTP
jgi:2',3'-cyclic-nucleotide 2'-phosphodiesterase (5'-nucleotidase family)